MKSFASFVAEEESHGLQQLPWDKNPKIGWWKDGDHLHMYHGTHVSRLGEIARHGIRAPEKGPTAGSVSLTHDPHTAHGYASMHGGESNFRSAGAQAQHVPHEDRAVLHLKIPRKWAEKNMNPHLRGNIDSVRDNLTNRAKYEAHALAGRPDHEHYATTELRFKDRVPPKFIQGYSKRNG